MKGLQGAPQPQFMLKGLFPTDQKVEERGDRGLVPTLNHGWDVIIEKKWKTCDPLPERMEKERIPCA